MAGSSSSSSSNSKSNNGAAEQSEGFIFMVEKRRNFLPIALENYAVEQVLFVNVLFEKVAISKGKTTWKITR